MKEMCVECGADLRADDFNKDVAVVPMVHSVPELKGVLHFLLRGPGCPGRWCHTRLRPRTKEFLESASKNYELHVCTFGARQYAHAIADLLDPEKKFFSHRILSRDEMCGGTRPISSTCGPTPSSRTRETSTRRPRLLPIGKNGSQSVLNQMPTLDAEPETKEEKENEKSTDGSNGKITNKDFKKPEKETKIEDEKDDQKNEKDEQKNYKGEESSKTCDQKMNIEVDEKVEENEPRWIETPDGQIEFRRCSVLLVY
ncbi:RNA polymerase II ctd phosphatase [Operophtera brumata]|uniref:protein-serine/threonine phosphatase n=1 Tax=Operophtera brumata TaxID=104452 RepID=A0A0L7L7E6_OPEBR|nr:RNA polymerase II ctd phosphatase [Operophtera brumata]